MILSTGTIVPENPHDDNYIELAMYLLGPDKPQTAVTWTSGNGSTSMVLDCNIDTAKRLFEQARMPGLVRVMYEAVSK